MVCGSGWLGRRRSASSFGEADNASAARGETDRFSRNGDPFVGSIGDGGRILIPVGGCRWSGLPMSTDVKYERYLLISLIVLGTFYVLHHA